MWLPTVFYVLIMFISIFLLLYPQNDSIPAPGGGAQASKYKDILYITACDCDLL